MTDTWMHNFTPLNADTGGNKEKWTSQVYICTYVLLPLRSESGTPVKKSMPIFLIALYISAGSKKSRTNSSNGPASWFLFWASRNCFKIKYIDIRFLRECIVYLTLAGRGGSKSSIKLFFVPPAHVEVLRPTLSGPCHHKMDVWSYPAAQGIQEGACFMLPPDWSMCVWTAKLRLSEAAHYHHVQGNTSIQAHPWK